MNLRRLLFGARRAADCLIDEPKSRRRHRADKRQQVILGRRTEKRRVRDGQPKSFARRYGPSPAGLLRFRASVREEGAVSVYQ